MQSLLGSIYTEVCMLIKSNAATNWLYLCWLICLVIKENTPCLVLFTLKLFVVSKFYDWEAVPQSCFRNRLFNPFHATGIFQYPLKTSENQRFFDVFRGVSKETSDMKWVQAIFWHVYFDGKKKYLSRLMYWYCNCDKYQTSQTADNCDKYRTSQTADNCDKYQTSQTADNCDKYRTPQTSARKIAANGFESYSKNIWFTPKFRPHLTSCWILSHLNREILLAWLMYLAFVHCKFCLHLSTPKLSRGHQISVLPISSKCTKVIWKWPWSWKDVLLPYRSKLHSTMAAGDFSNSFGKSWRSATFSKGYHCFD